jgi:ABC-type sugar transport system ATPase subunit
MIPALELQNIDLGYGNTRVVHSVSLTVRRGTVHAIAGENGSGKSTLLGALSGRLAPWSGEIMVEGESRTFRSPRDAIAAGIALVSQELSFVPELSIAENLGVGSYRGRRLLFRSSEVTADLARFIAMVGLDLPLTKLVGELTTHQCQLVEIARALASGARIILLDEPTSSLDSTEVEKLFACINTLRDQGYAFILITHRSRELHAIADEVSVLRDGRLVDHRPIGEVTDRWLVSSLVGREPSTVFPDRNHLRAGPVLQVNGLCDTDGRVKHSSFTVHQGEIVALAGLVGAGRSELLETIFGARHRAQGEVLVGQDRLAGNPADSLRCGVAMIFEERKTQGIIPRLSNSDNFGLTSAPLPLVPRQRERNLLSRWKRKLTIKGSERQVIGSLSGGNQQKVLLARALEQNPRVLLLDEPTRGVDVGAKTDIYHAIVEAAAAGCAVLLATSEMEEALGLADRILVLREGQIVDEQIGSMATEESIISVAAGISSQNYASRELAHV